MRSAFEAIQRRTVATEAINQIRDLIASGTLLPGQKLPSERALAELLAVSRPSLREAIRALCALGVLEIRPGSGMYVTSLSSEILARPLAFILSRNRQAISDLFEVRLMLEVGAAENAARVIDDAALERLSEIIIRLRGSIDNIEGFVEGDIAFHKIIHETAGNAILLALMESLSVLGRQSRMLTAQQREVREISLREHGEIYQALRNRDPERAGREMRAHLMRVRQCLDEMVWNSGASSES